MNNEEFAQKNTCCLKKVLVTGASGFIGSFLVEGGLEREMQVWAGVRKSSSRTYLKDPRIQFAELDFAHPGRLTEQLAVHKQLHGGWDYIIHCAGVTKCRHKDEFDKGNYVYTRNFVEALRTLDMVPRQFVYISSLSIFGPIHEDNYAPISERDTAMPNTAYGVSKLKSEHYLQSLNDFPTVIFRPTGVYGPRERDYFLMAKSIKQHIDFAPGFKRQDLTFIYVRDLVQAVYLAIEHGVRQRAYFVSDGNVYSSRTFSDLNRANEAREMTKKLGSIAERTGCAIVLIGHMNKGSGAKAAYRGMGSIDFFAVARSVMLVGRIEGQSNLRAMIQIKNNLAAFGHPKAFELAEDGFHWLGDYEITADEVLGGMVPKASKLEMRKETAQEWRIIMKGFGLDGKLFKGLTMGG